MVRFLSIELRSVVRIHPQLNSNFRREEGRQLSVIPGVRTTRCGHIERKDPDTVR